MISLHKNTMSKTKKMEISFAPLQGITDYIFRKVFHQHFKGVDDYYAPYLKFENDKSIKPGKVKDVLPENNEGIPFVPQVLVNNSADFKEMLILLSDYGYEEINLNLGCPYPMVTNRKLGAGLLEHPDNIAAILSEVMPGFTGKLSIKMRLGLNDTSNVFQILQLFNDYPLSKLIIHPRIAKQMYKGEADIDMFEQCLQHSTHHIVYNGDIDSAEKFRGLRDMFPSVNFWMIGRGLVANPFLAEEIKEGKTIEYSEKVKRFINFHDELIAEYEQRLSGQSHLLSKMKGMWIYFAQLFENGHKLHKKIKKARTREEYDSAIHFII